MVTLRPPDLTGVLAGLSTGFGLDRPARLTGEAALAGLAFLAAAVLRPPRLARGDVSTCSATSAAAFLVPRLVGAGEAVLSSDEVMAASFPLPLACAGEAGLGLGGLTAAFPRLLPLTAFSMMGEDRGVMMTVALPRCSPAGDFALAAGEATFAGEAGFAGVLALVVFAAGETALAGVDALVAGDLGLAVFGVANRR